MDSPPTSDGIWSFGDRDGQPIDVPAEWEVAYLLVETDTENWDHVTVYVQGQPKPVQVMLLGGMGRVVVPWERAGAGQYRIRVVVGEITDEREISIVPAKIQRDELSTMVFDIEQRLAPTIAMALQRTGAFTGLQINPPGAQTLAAELNRLAIAIHGDTLNRGLDTIVPEIARRPHSMLRTDEQWVRAESARRPVPARLASAFSRASNVGQSGSPLAVIDGRVEQSVDVYENQLLKLFITKTTHRLRRVQRLVGSGSDAVGEQVQSLTTALRRIERQAPFLREVSAPRHAPKQVSMVLAKRAEYRAMLAGYRRFIRNVTVVVDDPTLAAPLQNIPALYELWGTLKVAESLTAVVADLGYQLRSGTLIRRKDDVLNLVGRGAQLTFEHPPSGTVVRFREQANYPSASAGFHSVTYRQIPDIAIEVDRLDGSTDIYIFDPKYKLRAALEQDGTELRPGGPTKVDIDAMHTYRDAIRGPSKQRVVRYAAIMYPGPTTTFTPGIEALEARPRRMQKLDEDLRERIVEFLTHSDAPAT